MTQLHKETRQTAVCACAFSGSCVALVPFLCSILVLYNIFTTRPFFSFKSISPVIEVRTLVSSRATGWRTSLPIKKPGGFPVVLVFEMALPRCRCPIMAEHLTESALVLLLPVGTQW